MQLKIAFLFWVLAFVRAEQEVDVDECEEKYIKCSDAGERAVDDYTEENTEEPCRVMKESMQCLYDVHDECRNLHDPEEQDDIRELEDNLRKLEQNIAELCPHAYSGIPDETIQCVANLQDELIECAMDSLAEAMANIQLSVEGREPDDTVIKCSMYRAATKCVAKKVVERCGEEAAQLELFSDVADEMKECQKSDARESLNTLLHSTKLRLK